MDLSKKILLLGFISSVSCYSFAETIKDSRDGRAYKVENIGGKLWMAENLSYKMPKSSCYDFKESNCKQYGRLYYWEDAVKKACPKDFHVPTKEEWENFEKDLLTRLNQGGGQSEDLSTALKTKKNFIHGGWQDGVGTDRFGLNMQPAGWCELWKNGRTGRCGESGIFTGFWASGDGENYFNSSAVIVADEGFFIPESRTDDLTQYSVRCVSDADYCGNKKYKAEKGFCVGGKIFNYCNGEKYDPAEFYCLKDSLISFCGGKKVNENKEFCFADAIYQKCNHEDYNPVHYACVGKKLMQRCGSVNIDSTTHFCHAEKAYSLCAGNLYNPEEVVCINSKVQKKCGSASYDTLSHFCENDKIYELCNGEVYHPQEQVCENGVLFGLCGQVKYDTTYSFCHNSHVLKLCGGEKFDPLKELCYNGERRKFEKCGDTIVVEKSGKFCHDGKIYKQCDYVDFNPVNEGCCNNRIYNKSKYVCENGHIAQKCGNTTFDEDAFFCFNDDIIKKCNGSEYDLTSQGCCNEEIFEKKSHICQNERLLRFCDGTPYDTASAVCRFGKVIKYGFIKDKRDGRQYKTVKIDGQIWMAENLNYKTNDSYCFKDDESNCDVYGRLYKYGAAQNACPSGFHLPSKEDYNKLKEKAISYAGSKKDAHKILKSTSWEDSIYPDNSGIDAFGFGLFPAGSKHPLGHYNLDTRGGGNTMLWTSSQMGKDASYFFNVDFSSAFIDHNGNNFAYSVRCIKN